MFREKNESTYSILSTILKIKFGIQLKDSGIEFHNIYKMINLATGKENYLIFINDTEIKFVTPRDFVSHFIRFLSSNLDKLSKRYQYLINLQIDEFTDEISIEREYKEIDYYIHKQTDLLQLMNDYKEKLL
ncbi:hypothetical protein [Chryseobacterium sp. ISL-6]|uniref:hypothetical protein n=1 Tax=Chryseobacterium sp. ISL-6 TaxID=2819143 RepID=UPI001BEC6002|nr:hypothetical protein [Chryseobacterium sp. ISL-6]MBT2622835.1 hypothetical protein [Chryseobacterium sp. ISL-6]